MTIEFQAWPKTPRLFRDVVITEKIDGTNAAVAFEETDGGYQMGVQSRNRIITPDRDNAGFAQWCYDNTEDLFATLGIGRHFGEWWGQGIQRKYGMPTKRFSLFNTGRYADVDLSAVEGLGVVPVLYEGKFSEAAVTWCLDELRLKGSFAAPGFMNPEGVCVFHTQSRQVYKVLLENDEIPKSLAGVS